MHVHMYSACGIVYAAVAEVQGVYVATTYVYICLLLISFILAIYHLYTYNNLCLCSCKR